jgi:anti-sigma regulatory factor (Ser/Thr protein kinase)
MRELSHHILDIVRNSVEAGAHRVDLVVTEEAAADRLTIVVRDDGRGMGAETLEHVTDPFYTTRTTRRVGLGLSLFEATCERCEGALTVASEPGTGTKVTATMRRSHIDRMPLGDMGALAQAVACADGDMRFVYSHTLDGLHFELDTEELRQELDDVPLTEPSVLTWVRAYVNEGLQEIGAGP